MFCLLWGILRGLGFTFVDRITPLILLRFPTLGLMLLLQLLGLPCSLDVG
jgi:hypothetical protein